MVLCTHMASELENDREQSQVREGGRQREVPVIARRAGEARVHEVVHRRLYTLCLVGPTLLLLLREE